MLNPWIDRAERLGTTSTPSVSTTVAWGSIDVMSMITVGVPSSSKARWVELERADEEPGEIESLSCLPPPHVDSSVLYGGVLY